MMAWKKKVPAKNQEPDESELPPMPAPPKKKVQEVKESEVEERWTVQSIPTQSAPFVVDNEDDKAYTIEQALVKLLNNQEEILSTLKE